MPKRRAITVKSDNDDGSPESSQASKRARTEDSETGHQELPPQVIRRAARVNGKSRRRADGGGAEEDEEDDMVEQTALDEDEEKKFEEEHEEEIREKLMSKGKGQGGIAEMGIIEHLEMHQFMCHKYLTFSFGPQINFIIGHNGSGKSAVLSALTVALGGKATSTGRGSGLKSFIREGQSVAEVTVTLKNQGEEAYRPKDYGKSIVITRRFTKEGSSSYKIKSKDGRIISTKREELSAICDHMNIQVDNPMNILTQDSARQFLSASQPADKYRFFLRGTQLSQLSEEYQTCLENIGQTQKVLKRKSEAIPELEEALEEATARFQEAAKAREQRHKADELKKELAWAHVASKEDELKAKVEEVAKLSRRLPKIKDALAEAEEKFAEASLVVETQEQSLADLGEIETLQARKNKLQENIRENKNKLTKLRNEEKQMVQSITNTNKHIEALERQIADETAKTEAFSQGKRDETTHKFEQAKANYEAADKELQGIKEGRARKTAEAEVMKQQGLKIEADLNPKKNRIVECQEQLRRCQERARNKLAPFGSNMDKVLAAIQQMNWYGRKPVGPFGLYVDVKGKQWAPLMRVQLGSLMNGFVITDARDRQLLDNLLKDHGNRNCMIVITEVDLFDYSRGEPPEQYLTVLRALQISDPFVLRILINQAHIESTFLAPTRAEADRILLEVGRGGVAWSGDLFRVQRFPEGGGTSNVLPRLSENRGDIRHQFFTGDNVEEEKRRWQEEIKNAETAYNESRADIDKLKLQYNRLQTEIKALTAQETQALQNVKNLKSIRDTLQEELNEDLPVGIQGLQDAKRDSEEEKNFLTTQFEELQKKKAELDVLQRPLIEKLDGVRGQILGFENQQEGIRKEIEDAVQKRLEAQNSKNHYTAKLADEDSKVKAVEEVAKGLQEEFESWTAKAEEYCERFKNPRKADEVQRNLDAVQAALREREKRHGATVEEMTIEVNKKKAALDTAKKDLKNMLALNKALRRSVKVRLAKWHEFRRHIALRCKVYFQYHLSNRGYYGKVLFDHVNGTLTLKVQTDDQTLTQNNREKDPRSLSGGEKSFSTICLLLSLWESIGCPIRCLDEFDVFMDAVNRRISMRMMIDTANSSKGKQYVLITPQDMTNINIGNTVRVHRMTDPERGQGVLAFQ
ncbi:hypothetical protein AcW1_007861 [Taiwanofungus camphoratus]|nr:hypothetical protein AcW2_007081 [Antrodia cinnamomea]KAI0923276.1 hypothetical protein AcV7_005833 [Antrodia cinnamomea]KAI0953710.1 hypothetical protein AcW1_007861 [Antrodia cinnamomea]